MVLLAPLAFPMAVGPARLRSTTRRDGDLNADLVEPVLLAARQRAIVDLPWTWLREVHGADVVTVTRPGDHVGAIADAAVTAARGAVLAVWVGDCAPVALIGDRGVIGVAHAGWRGVAAGVLPATVRTMRAMGAGSIVAHVGPHIHAPCYEFGAADLDDLADRFGPTVRSTTADGTAALDLGATVAASLAEVDVPVASLGSCTACSADLWSYRARRESGRQALAVWLAPAP